MRPLLDADRLIVAGAALLALTAPILLLRSEPQAIDLPADTAVTPLRTAVVEPLGPALEAPLFNRDRSPLPPEPAAAETAADAAPPAPPPALVGTIVRKRGGGLALVKTAAGETVALRVGEEIDGWRLVSVGESEAVLDQGSRRETATLDFRNKRPAASAVPTSTAGDGQHASPPSASAVTSPTTPPGGPTG